MCYLDRETEKRAPCRGYRGASYYFVGSIQDEGEIVFDTSREVPSVLGVVDSISFAGQCTVRYDDGRPKSRTSKLCSVASLL